MTIRCSRCRQKINPTESTYIALLDKQGSKIDYRIERASKVKTDSVAIHLNGDTQCGKEVSGFRVNLLKTIGLPGDVDTQFLDYL